MIHVIVGKRTAIFHLSCITGVAAAVLFFWTGCISTGKDKTDSQAISGEMRPFLPAQVTTGIQLSEGRCPTLFSGTSSAAWLQPDMPMPDAETEEVFSMFGTNFLVFRVEIESVFADMSIAYDAVGFRGMQVYLLTPQEEQVHPVQTIIGKNLVEEQKGALRAFKRVNYLLFSRDALALFVPWTGAPLGSVRLVLEGFDSTFYFEWHPQTPDSLPGAPLGEMPAVRAGKDKMQETGRKTRAFLRHFN